jgi:hypothetical protein
MDKEGEGGRREGVWREYGGRKETNILAFSPAHKPVREWIISRRKEGGRRKGE